MTDTKGVGLLKDPATAGSVVSITAHQLRRPFTWGLHKLLSPDPPGNSHSLRERNVSADANKNAQKQLCKFTYGFFYYSTHTVVL